MQFEGRTAKAKKCAWEAGRKFAEKYRYRTNQHREEQARGAGREQGRQEMSWEAAQRGMVRTLLVVYKILHYGIQYGTQTVRVKAPGSGHANQEGTRQAQHDVETKPPCLLLLAAGE